ncbi:MAG: NAD(P)H-dependent glycerol-3-phosphate dehydrogenase [Bacteroides sp.]|nr:NAD(P)H-dependent glycerol-3-phosphate dehydrogenase [Lachnospiraceae bacterium]MCM1333311.1 NAD(P)H-dependent glycerol-3-phosphate dehydrogenase [Bacteroides sp.]MCM1389987.1 NAD(P)H-dependent glycerol-3-phosphate dehydrogenase [Bacteroides sp.]
MDSCGGRKIAVMGGGSWATALAKILLHNCSEIIWYMRRDDRIEEFKRLGHNPAYLSDVEFPIDRIRFYSDINEACRQADTLLMAMPSPYFKNHLAKLDADISGKTVVVATKGLIPDENELISDYLEARWGVDPDRIIVVSGPCHAEEVALGRLSYLTVACNDIEHARSFAALLNSKKMKTLVSTDVRGIEFAGVLKNVYAIASGMVHGFKEGDNYQAILISNSIREMARFIGAVVPGQRCISDSVYLGDLLVTSYSRFSRNHNFGTMIGRGISVKRAMMEMEMVAEGYYGAKCMHEINEKYKVNMPILDCVYDTLYNNCPIARTIERMSYEFE